MLARISNLGDADLVPVVHLPLAGCQCVCLFAALVMLRGAPLAPDQPGLACACTAVLMFVCLSNLGDAGPGPVHSGPH